MDVHWLSYGRPSVPLWTSISFHTGVNQYLCGRPLAFIRASVITSVDVHWLSYGRPSVPLWTSISFQTDINKNFCDVHQPSYGRPAVPLWTSISFYQFLYTCLAVPSLTSINFLTDIHQYLCGRPLVFNCLSSSAILDVSYHRKSISTSMDGH